MALVKSSFKKTIIFSIIAGFFIASSFLAGHVHSVILSVIAAGIFAFFSLSKISSFKIQKLLLLIFTGGIVTIGLSLPQLLATREYLKLSYKWYGKGHTEYPHVVPFGEFIESSLAFQDFLTAITGRGVTAVDGGTFFITITGLIFAMIGLLFGVFLLQNKTSVYWPSFATLLLSISFAYSIVWPLGVIFYNFPIINLVRAPSRALFLFAFAGSLMAGIGLNIIINKASGFFKKNKIPHSQILGSCCGILFLLSSAYEVFHWFPARTFKSFEQYSVVATPILSDPVSNKLVELTKESGNKYRYYSTRDDLAPNIGNLFPLFSAHGYRSSRTKIFHDYFDFNPLSEKSNLLGIRWWVSKNKIENLKLLYAIDGRNIYERETYPLFYQPHQSSNDASRIVEQVTWKTNGVTVEFSGPIKGPLVFAQPFFPGFYAFADGVEYDIHNYSNLMAINLLAPAKKVDFIYRPKWFTIGIFVNNITAALCMFSLFLLCFLKKEIVINNSLVNKFSFVSKIPMRVYEIFIVAFIFLCAIAIACIKIQMPGIYYDEILFANAALGSKVNSFIRYSFLGVPVLLMDYIGALKAWIYAPIFDFFGVSPATIRFPAILIGVTGGLLSVLTIRRYFGAKAGLYCAFLTFFDPALLIHSRLDWGPTALMFLFRGLLMFGIAFWWSNGKPAGLWLAVSASLLGAFDKLNFIWILAGVWISVMAFCWPKIKAYYIENRVASLAQLLLLGSGSLFFLYRAISISTTLQNSDISLVDRIAVAWNLTYLTFIGGGPLDFICGDGKALAKWMVPAYVFVFCVCFLRVLIFKTAFCWKKWLFLLSSTILLAAAFVLTKSATGPHHAAVLAGLPAMLAAPILASPINRKNGSFLARACSYASILSAVLLCGSMLFTTLFVIFSFQKTKNPNWDIAHNKLAEVVKKYPNHHFLTSDWGMGTQLIAFSKGKMSIDDSWPNFLNIDSHQFQTAHKDYASQISTKFPCVLISRAVGRENFPIANSNAVNFLLNSGLHFSELNPLPDINGDPLIRIFLIPSREVSEKSTKQSNFQQNQVPKVENWGPRTTKKGSRFNIQPSGLSAMWISIKGVSKHSESHIDFAGSKIAGSDLSIQDDVVTFIVRDLLVSKSGRYPIHIFEGDTGRKIFVGNFVVE
jgi:hypothetical protein